MYLELEGITFELQLLRELFSFIVSRRCSCKVISIGFKITRAVVFINALILVFKYGFMMVWFYVYLKVSRCLDNCGIEGCGAACTTQIIWNDGENVRIEGCNCTTQLILMALYYFGCGAGVLVCQDMAVTIYFKMI